MTAKEAIKYLKSSGYSDEQIYSIIIALKCVDNETVLKALEEAEWKGVTAWTLEQRTNFQ